MNAADHIRALIADFGLREGEWVITCSVRVEAAGPAEVRRVYVARPPAERQEFGRGWLEHASGGTIVVSVTGEAA